MKTNFFENKEQYDKFIKNWKQQFAAGRKLDRNDDGHKIKKLTLTHFLFYAVLRGHDPKASLSDNTWVTYHRYDLSSIHRGGLWADRMAEFFGISKEEIQRAAISLDDYLNGNITFQEVLEEIQVHEEIAEAV